MTSRWSYQGLVTSEGGPFVFFDGAVVTSWEGIENGSDDYRRACEIFNDGSERHGGVVLTKSGVSGAVWEASGAGAVAIFSSSDSDFAFVRCWPDTDAEFQQAASEFLDVPSTISSPFARFSVPSGWLAILWATESGSDAWDDTVSAAGAAPGVLSVPTAAFALACQPGTYALRSDSVKTSLGEARRCFASRTR